MPRLIRSDEHGPYVLTGGYAFRPPVNSKVEVGTKVQATHVGGTRTARVANEVWTSFSTDPRYVDYVGEDELMTRARTHEKPNVRALYDAHVRNWQDYLRSRRIEIGDRVRVTGIQPNEPNPLTVGDEGEVTFVDDAGTMWVLWKSGRRLGLLSTDPFEKVI